MRVLLTNSQLHLRGGAELMIRDLARGLQTLGHSVMVFSSDLGRHERLLESDLVPVATDLENLPVMPDIIHALHHLDAMSALATLPGVPAVYHWPGAGGMECAPIHPRIYHYLAVSQTAAERMAAEFGVAADDITVFPDWVDLARFREARTPPPRPARALHFECLHRADDGLISALREMALRHRIDLDFLDPHFNPATDGTEDLLPAYDIVFASGRAAVEALACGCAVVATTSGKIGEMFLPENLDRMQKSHFSVEAQDVCTRMDRMESELGRYAPHACAAVSEELRRRANLNPAVDKLLAIYRQVIDLHRNTVEDVPGESIAVSRYLRRIEPQITVTDHSMGRNWISPARPVTCKELDDRLRLVEHDLPEAEFAQEGTF